LSRSGSPSFGYGRNPTRDGANLCPKCVSKQTLYPSKGCRVASLLALRLKILSELWLFILKKIRKHIDSKKIKIEKIHLTSVRTENRPSTYYLGFFQNIFQFFFENFFKYKEKLNINILYLSSCSPPKTSKFSYHTVR